MKKFTTKILPLLLFLFAFLISSGLKAQGACIASFTHFTDVSGDESFTPVLVGSAPFTYLWDFGDGTTSTLSNPLHSFPGSGGYVVCLTIVDAGGCTNSFCDVVTIGGGGSSCSASFGYTIDTTGFADFVATATGTPPISYFWEFGDGTSMVGSATETHIYSGPGPWTATLTITDGSGCVDSIDKIVYLPTGGGGGTCSVTFTHAPDPFLGGEMFTPSATGTGPFFYNWDFGDGSTSSTEVPSHVYFFTGSYTVCVTITDATGCSNTFCDLVFIGGGGGFCYSDFTYTIDSSGNAVFTGSATGSPPISYSWDFGDGSFSSGGAIVSHTYSGIGPWFANLTTTDGSGCVADYSDVVLLPGGGSCYVSFSHYSDPYWGGEVFSSYPSGTGPFSYYWDFGDGGSSTLENPIYTYSGTGTFAVCLTISDPTGCTFTYCDSVYIWGGGACTADFTYTIDTLGNAVFDASSAGGVPPFYYSWDFGDGTYGYAGPIETHTYSGTGPWFVTLYVYDYFGCSATYYDMVVLPGSGPGVCTMGFTPYPSLCNNLSFFATPGFVPDSYYWDFGDGSFDTTTAASTSHYFGSDGDYVVCVTGTNAAMGCTVSWCNLVNVTCGWSFCSAAPSSATDASGVTYLTASAYGSAPYTYFWDFGDGTSSTLANPTHIYPSGTWNACLTVVDATGCTTTECIWVSIGGGGGCSAGYSYLVTSGGPVEFAAFGSGTGIISYTWNFGDGTTGVGSPISHTYASGGYYPVCLLAMDASGCSFSYCDTIFVPGTSTLNSICGLVLLPSGVPADTAIAYLIEYDAISGFIDTVASETIGSSSGATAYCFDLVPDGTYFVKAALAPASSDFSGYLPTYYGDVITWSLASPITLPSPPATYSIVLQEGLSPVGLGSISGFVLTYGSGDPVPDVAIIVTDLFGNPVQYTYSVTDGSYSFSGLAFGSYIVYAEVAGKTIEPAAVTLSAANPNITDLIFLVDSETVSVSLKDDITLSGVSLNPTLTQGLTVLKISQEKVESASFTVYGINGAEVMTQSLNLKSGDNEFSLDFSEFANGMYFLQLQLGERQQVMKVVKY